MGKLAIKPAHYQSLKKKIFSFMDKHKMLSAKKGLSSMRYRWDIYWACGGAFTNASEFRYLKDDHIDSALKSILNEYLKK